MTRRDLLAAAGAAALMPPRRLPAQETTMPTPLPLPRVARFEQIAYGLFVHWGLFSIPGRCVWAMHPRRFPQDEYRRLPAQFRADEFDPRAWAAVARRAGMQYITLTSRQHDGFSLYDTRGLSDWDVTASAAGRDLVLEFVTACRAEGLVPFLYHTLYDWYQPSFEADFPAYLDYLRRSIELLCTHYGELGGFWFDGTWSKPEADWEEDALYGLIRRLQPEAMIINNTGVAAVGQLGHPEIDAVTFEQARPAPMDRAGHTKYVAAEMCQSLNHWWGHTPLDFGYLSPQHIIETLCACRRAGANYLLNVGPTPGGRIPDYEAAALARAGELVATHSELIHSGRPCGIAGDGLDFGLAVGERRFLLVHNLSLRGGELVTPPAGPGPRAFRGLDREVRRVRWLDNGEEPRIVEQAEGRLVIEATGYPNGVNLVARVAELE